MNKRDPFYDNLKGILIILVFFGHLLSPLRSEVREAAYIYKFIYSFHMPLFIIISGYFSKRQTIRSNIKLFVILMISQISFTYLLKGEVIFFDFHFGLWYLASLLTWRMIVLVIPDTKTLLVIALIIGLLRGYTELDRFLALARTGTFFIYFVIGYSLSKENLLKLRSLISIKTASVLLLTIFIITIITMNVFDITVYNYWFSGDKQYVTMLKGKPMVLGFVYQFFTYIISLMISLVVLNFVSKRQIPIVNTLGKMTLLYYLGQAFITYYIRYNNYYDKYSLGIFHLALMAIIFSILIYMISIMIDYMKKKQQF